MGQLYPPPPEIMEQIASHRRWLDSRGDDGHCIYLAFEDHEALDLRGAMLSEGMFQETNLSGSRLDGADLARIVGNGIRLAGASMVDAIAAKAELVGADLRGVDGQRAIFRNARLREARFDGAQLRGAHFTGADGIQASFRDADLRDTDFSGALLSAADLSGAHLAGANLDRAQLSIDTRLVGADGIDQVIASELHIGNQRYEGATVHEALCSLPGGQRR